MNTSENIRKKPETKYGNMNLFPPSSKKVRIAKIQDGGELGSYNW
jgi:hypothetical protein